MKKIKVLLKTELVESFLKAIRQAIEGAKAEAKLDEGGKTIVIVEFPETAIKALDEVLNEFNQDGTLEVEDVDTGEGKSDPAGRRLDGALPDFDLERPEANRRDELPPRTNRPRQPKAKQTGLPLERLASTLVIGLLAVAVIAIAALMFAWVGHNKIDWAAKVANEAKVAVEALTAQDGTITRLGKDVDEVKGHFAKNGDVTLALADLEKEKGAKDAANSAKQTANEAKDAVNALTADDGAITGLAKRVQALEEKKVASAADVSRAQASAEWAAVKAENDAMLMKLAEVRRADPNGELAKLLDDDVKKAFTDAKKRAALKQQIETAWLNRPAPAPTAITQTIVPEDNAIPKLKDEIAAVKKIAAESHEAAEIIATSPKPGFLGHSVKESNKARARAALGIAPIEDAKPAKPPRPRINREF